MSALTPAQRAMRLINRLPDAEVGSKWTNLLPLGLAAEVDVPLYRNGVTTEWMLARGPSTATIQVRSNLVVIAAGAIQPLNTWRPYTVVRAEDKQTGGLEFVVESRCPDEARAVLRSLAMIVPAGDRVLADPDLVSARLAEVEKVLNLGSM